MLDSLDTLRAAVECALPAGEGIPAGLEVGADRHIRDALESMLPGATDLLAGLLDAYAAEQGEPEGFASLPIEDRAVVLRKMLTEPIADVRELAEAVLLFGYGAVYSEWSGFDRDTRTLKPPPVWDAIGYGGPSDGHPDYGHA